MRPVVELFREAGCEVHGAAVAWRTARALGADCGIRPWSMARLLNSVAKGRLVPNDRTVIVVDEAGMLATRQMHRILELAGRTGCRIILCGDTQQQQAIEAGPGLRLARDEAGSVRVDTIRRQKADAEDVLRQLEGYDEATARLKLDVMPEAERRAKAAAFEALPAEARAQVLPWQVEASEAFRDRRAGDAIEAYRSRGRFHLCADTEATLRRVVDDWADFRDRNPDRSTAVIARTHDEVDALSALMRERTLEGGRGERVTVRVARGRGSRPDLGPLEIAVGDRLRIGATLWDHQLFNGSIVTVDSLRTDRAADGGERVLIRGRAEDGREVAFHADEVRDWHGHVRIEHGYALTITSAQGLTVDEAFLLADAAPARETIYPAATRHREGLNIYVDRRAAAAETEERRPEHRTASRSRTRRSSGCSPGAGRASRRRRRRRTTCRRRSAGRSAGTGAPRAPCRGTGWRRTTTARAGSRASRGGCANGASSRTTAPRWMRCWRTSRTPKGRSRRTGARPGTRAGGRCSGRGPARSPRRRGRGRRDRGAAAPPQALHAAAAPTRRGLARTARLRARRRGGADAV